ncbi:MAG: hypothetical protein ACJAR2_003801 [Ilumatobacter sp.]|jgi:hypothetical protein
MLRLIPTSRGGHRKLGPTNPRAAAARVSNLAAWANSTVDENSMDTI